MNFRGVVLILFLRHATENNDNCSYQQLNELMKNQQAETRQYLIENQEEIQKIIDQQKKERTQKQKKGPTIRNKMLLNGKQKFFRAFLIFYSKNEIKIFNFFIL